jgi:ubiquinone/menaquinone biosynthesis C-methylase UbiE
MVKSEESIQREYYAKTALEYDANHVTGDPEHNLALRYISGLLEVLSAKTLLDVGCGTGRGVAHVRQFHEEVRAFGMEPVEQLLNVAVTKGVPPHALVRGDATHLPFGDGAFDVVMELGVLHHVPRPELVVEEMLRVARKAVFISDANLFGQGRASLRVLKFLLYRAGLWQVVKYAQTGGRGYILSEGDGLSYSYSAYFHYGALSRWANRVIVVPLISDTKLARWPRPLFADRCVLLGAIRDEFL